MKNDIDTFLIELEKNNETFKQWGKLYMIEENIINEKFYHAITLQISRNHQDLMN